MIVVRSLRFLTLAAIGCTLASGDLFAQQLTIADQQSGSGGGMGVVSVRTAPGVPDDHFMMVQPMIAGKIMMEGFGGELEHTVKGAPFTAQASTSTTQVLGDGNRISRTSESSLARDSEGRTRREMSIEKIGPWSTDTNGRMVIIRDPVASVSYVLSPDGQHAEKTPMAMTFDTRVEAPTAEAKAKHEAEMAAHVRDVKTRVAAGETRTMTYAAGGGEFNTFILAGGEESEGKKESLGEQNIEGVRAQGTRVTRTIPAGKIGNERPIEIVSETWYSPDLQMVVQSRNSDPRVGETIYKLSNIVLAEPDASLFQPPAGVTIEDHTKMMRMKLREEGLQRQPQPDLPPPPPMQP
jgi:hypothetical protein